MDEFNSTDNQTLQNGKKRLAFLEVGLFEISFVLIIIIVLFGTLNYFNILSLSTLYPNQFGFLPHQAIINQTKTTVASIPTPTPIPFSYIPTNQAPTAEISKYTTSAKTDFGKPYYNADAKSFATDGILSAYNDSYLTLITATGALNFMLTKDTTFSKYASAPEKINTSVTPQTLTKEEFLTKENLGKSVQLYYSNSNITTEIYLSPE